MGFPSAVRNVYRALDLPPGWKRVSHDCGRLSRSQLDGAHGTDKSQRQQHKRARDDGTMLIFVTRTKATRQRDDDTGTLARTVKIRDPNSDNHERTKQTRARRPGRRERDNTNNRSTGNGSTTKHYTFRPVPARRAAAAASSNDGAAGGCSWFSGGNDGWGDAPVRAPRRRRTRRRQAGFRRRTRHDDDDVNVGPSVASNCGTASGANVVVAATAVAADTATDAEQGAID